MKKKVAAIIGGVIITMAGSTPAEMGHSMNSHDHKSGEMKHEESSLALDTIVTTGWAGNHVSMLEV